MGKSGNQILRIIILSQWHNASLDIHCIMCGSECEVCQIPSEVD
uniref:Uncharacterized protein n=1 Tax=Arundo donax TaxID=35708 RepID=A0A0A9TYJ7_ARUDO